MTAVVNGIHRQDGTRWARVLADPSSQVRKAAATHGYCTPQFVWTGLVIWGCVNWSAIRAIL